MGGLRRAALAAGLVACAAAAPARADDLVGFGSDGTGITAQAAAQLTTTGAIAVDFHGDPAAGCAQRNLCDVSGSAIWRPQARGSVSAIRLRSKRRRVLFVTVTLGGGDLTGNSAGTTSRTQRTAAGTACADAVVGPFGGFAAQSTGQSVRIGPGVGSFTGSAPDLFATRCPGPLLSDVAKLLPAATLRFSDVEKGRRTIDLSGGGMLSSGGFAGTVRSTLALHLGPGHSSHRDTGRSPRGRTVRRRIVEAEYEMRLTGTVPIDLAGAPDAAVCGPLDACGLAGTVTVTPPATGEAYLEADAPASVPAARLRASLGLADGTPVHGLGIDGGGSFDRRAVAEAALTRDGAPACTDRVPSASPGVDLEVAGGRVTATFGAEAAAILHTRCGGPTSADVAGGGSLARGSVPLSAMRSADVTIPLDRGRSFDAGSYRGRARPALHVVLHRRRVRILVIREPATFVEIKSSAGP